MLHAVEEVNIGGQLYYKLPNGKLMPPISGGRSEGDASGQPNYAELMELVKKQQAQLDSYHNELTEQKSQFDELVGAIAEAVEEGEEGEEGEAEEEEQVYNNTRQTRDGKGQDTQEVAALMRELNKMRKQMEEMQNVIVERDAQMEDEREMRLASQRDSLLQQALQENGVLPTAMDAALKLFRENVAYDEEQDEFYFVEDKTGVKLPISEGIKDNMPDYLKIPSVKHGGSGGRGSQTTAMLEQARGTLSKLEAQAKKSGSEQDIAAYHAAKKKLIEVEASRSVGQSAGGALQPRKLTPVAVGTGREVPVEE